MRQLHHDLEMAISVTVLIDAFVTIVFYVVKRLLLDSQPLNLSFQFTINYDLFMNAVDYSYP